MKENILSQTKFVVSKKIERIELVLIIIGVIFTPIVIPYLISNATTQYIIGSMVNTALIFAGIQIKGFKKIIGIITLPSLYVLSSGLIFKSTSIYMMYMIPFIWFGNLALVYLYRYFYVKKNINYVASSLISIIIKTLIIATGVNLLIVLTSLGNQIEIAETLKIAMGVNQLITATIGSILALGIVSIYKTQTLKA